MRHAIEAKFKYQAVDPNNPDVVVGGAIGESQYMLAWRMVQLQAQYPHLHIH